MLCAGEFSRDLMMNRKLPNGDLSVDGPFLDAAFLPAEVALCLHGERLGKAAAKEKVGLALSRPDGTTFVEELELPAPENASEEDWRILERHVKRMLWQKGGSRLFVAGAPEWARRLRGTYCTAPSGERAFDADFMGQKLFGEAFSVAHCDAGEMPAAREPELELGGNLDGCRIGFDLGGSDRKCAAVIDGKVVFSEEITWDPYFQTDPEYHRAGIEDSLRLAARHLPRVDAIGGSAAGVYINNEVLAGSLFRGLRTVDFDRHIRGLFRDLENEWGVPVAVVNDGEVTALAAALSAGGGGILGVAMGTSTAAGYVNPRGKLTCWLNELAFTPVDYRGEGAPVDEWSGDGGCGVQYFSQQAVARLGPAAGIPLEPCETFAEYLKRLQALFDSGDAGARKVFDTIGFYLGHTLPFWRRSYAFDKVLLLGRVMSGEAGECIVREAKRVLAEHYPETAENLSFLEVNERDKRHGQAIAAASLPVLKKE